MRPKLTLELSENWRCPWPKSSPPPPKSQSRTRESDCAVVQLTFHQSPAAHQPFCQLYPAPPLMELSAFAELYASAPPRSTPAAAEDTRRTVPAPPRVPPPYAIVSSRTAFALL